jgi:mono/diheme cytochrome c family protein
MDETLFYVFGITLVVSALVVSAVGLRFKGFPASRAALVAIVVYFAGMVAATTTFAVLNAADQQHEREAKEAAAGQQAPATTTTGQGSTAGAPPAAAQQFATSCGGCHTLAAANTMGTVGPNLDQTAPSKAQVLSAIQKGGLGSGTMPPGLLQGTEAEQVSDYVATSAGK